MLGTDRGRCLDNGVERTACGLVHPLGWCSGPCGGRAVQWRELLIQRVLGKGLEGVTEQGPWIAAPFARWTTTHTMLGTASTIPSP